MNQKVQILTEKLDQSIKDNKKKDKQIITNDKEISKLKEIVKDYK